MEKIFCLHKRILIVLILLITGLAPLYSISQQDINTLISFAESIIKIAETKGIDITGITIEEYYITVIEEAYTELEELFNKNSWTFEEIEKILYPIGLIMSFVNEIKEDYVLEILEDEGITKEDIDVVLKNAEKLSKYFITLDLEDWREELDMEDFDLDDLDPGDDIEEFDYPVEDFDNPDDPGDAPPEDVPPPY